MRLMGLMVCATLVAAAHAQEDPAFEERAVERAAGPADADAAEAPNPTGGYGIEEIVVTSQRRTQNLQDVPIAVTAFDQSRIESHMIEDASDYIRRIPNVSSNEGEFGRHDRQIGIRGVSNLNRLGLGSSFTYYIDDFAIGLGAVNSSLYDVERIEVLRGPQGTLFGRNASAGAISITTNKPDMESRTASFEVGTANYDAFGRFGSRGHLNLPVSDRIALRLVGNFAFSDSPFENLGPGEPNPGSETWDGRAALRYRVTDSLTADLAYTAADERRTDLIGVGTGVLSASAKATFGLSEAVDEGAGFYPSNTTAYYADNPESMRDQLSQTVLQLRQDFDSFAVVGILGTGETDFVVLADVDKTTDFLVDARVTTVRSVQSQELRLEADRNDWDIVGGLYHIRQDDVGGEDVFISSAAAAAFGAGATGLGASGLLRPTFPTANQVPADEAVTTGYFERHEAEAYAAFADASWRPFEPWTFGLGLRYARERVQLAGVVHDIGGDISYGPNSLEFTDLSPRFVVAWQAADQLNLYANVAKGFKAGGLNDILAEGVPPSYDAETLWNYEAGVKATLAGGRVRLNSAAFLLLWDNLQSFVVHINEDGTVRSFIDNAARARSMGLEVEAEVALMPRLHLNSSLGLLKGEFLDFRNVGISSPQVASCDAQDGVEDQMCDLSGFQLPNAPDLSFSADLAYELPVLAAFQPTATLEYSYRDDLHDSIIHEVESNEYPFRVPAFDNLNLRLALEDRRARISFFVENLLDDNHFTKTNTFLSFVGVTVAPERRIFGVRFRYLLD